MIAIIDYGMGNVGSVQNALRALGFESEISRDPAAVISSSHVIMPGVGAFGDGMESLKATGLVDVLQKEVVEKGKPFLGLCLGMQMLGTMGNEGGDAIPGLGWIPGTVRRISVDEKKFPIPHVGWNDVIPSATSRLFNGVARPIFYFVHSYVLEPENKQAITARTDHGETFPAAVEKGNIFGVQFHPEKSQQAGLQVLENFLKI